MKVFNLTNSSRMGNSRKKPVPMMGFGNHVVITLSKELCIQLGVTTQSRVEIIQVAELDWYVRFTDSKEGIPVRERKDTGILLFNSSVIVEAIRLDLNRGGRTVPDEAKGFSLHVSVSINPELNAYFIIPRPSYRLPNAK